MKLISIIYVDCGFHCLRDFFIFLHYCGLLYVTSTRLANTYLTKSLPKQNVFTPYMVLANLTHTRCVLVIHKCHHIAHIGTCACYTTFQKFMGTRFQRKGKKRRITQAVKATSHIKTNATPHINTNANPHININVTPHIKETKNRVLKHNGRQGWTSRRAAGDSEPQVPLLFSLDGEGGK